MPSTELSTKEGTRQLIELAVSCGRKFQNEQTGFVHYFYTKEDEKDNAAIPVYENLLFALALMRTKSADTVQEGKTIIERILPFQNTTELIGKGGFPIYLHDYPHCKDRLLGIRLLPPIYQILKNFHHVIGAPLKNRLIQAATHLLGQCFHAVEEKPAPYSLAFTLGVAAQALGRFLENNELVEQGRKIQTTLKHPQEEVAWYCTNTLSELLIALQLVEGSELPEGWDGFWQYLSDTWNRSSCSYIGPGWREYQRGEEPQPALYDIFMGFATGIYSYRSFEVHPFQLQAALIYDLQQQLPSPKGSIQGKIEASPWFCTQNDIYGLCLLGKKAPIPAGNEKGYVPFKVVWGDRTRAHSFVSQGGNMEGITYEWHPDGYVGMEITLGVTPNVEDKEKAREVIFFTEALEGVAIRVNGRAATTFTMKDVVEVVSNGMLFSLAFQVVEGDGSFVGHIMRGNRPSQVALKGEHRLEAYDWQIFLRTVYRTTPCRILIDMQLKGDPL